MSVEKPTIITYEAIDSPCEARIEIKSIATKFGEHLMSIYEDTGEIPKNLTLRFREQERITQETIAMRGMLKLAVLGGNQIHVAKEIGIAASTLRKFLNEKSNPYKETIDLIKSWALANHLELYKRFGGSNLVRMALSAEELKAISATMSLNF